MQAPRSPRSWSQWLGFRSCSVLLLLAASQPSHAQESVDNPRSQRLYLPILAHHQPSAPPSTGSTTHAPLFPPQPAGITNVVWLTDAPVAAVEAAVVSEQQAIFAAQTSSAVQAALGERFAWIGVVNQEDKEQSSAPTTVVTYFSHSANTTVAVTLAQGAVAAIERIAPEVYQPELAPGEVAEAIALARAHFAEQGIATVPALVGYGILAYQPSGPSGFYPQRVVYVSFHAQEDAPPLYLAWVDLTYQRILQSQEG